VVQKVVRLSAFAAEYGRRRELALRSVEWDQLSNPLLPGAFVSWADRVRFSLPSKLRVALDAQGVKDTDWKAQYESLGPVHKQQSHNCHRSRGFAERDSQ
jgi:hypothetical protein